MLRRCLIPVALSVALVVPTAIAEPAAAEPVKVVQVDLAQPDGWWGWTTCLASVAVWTGANALAAVRVAALVKKAGSVKAAIQRVQRAVARTPRAKKRLAVIAAISAVAADILGLDAVIDKCFN